MSESDQDRIRLAEAMGWVPNRTNEKWTDPVTGTGGNRLLDLPDPFTDANDDYACLQWAIKEFDPDAYLRALTQVVGSYAYLHEYRVGYWAQAALKCLPTGRTVMDKEKLSILGLWGAGKMIGSPYDEQELMAWAAAEIKRLSTEGAPSWGDEVPSSDGWYWALTQFGPEILEVKYSAPFHGVSEYKAWYEDHWFPVTMDFFRKWAGPLAPPAGGATDD